MLGCLPSDLEERLTEREYVEIGLFYALKDQNNPIHGRLAQTDLEENEAALLQEMAAETARLRGA